MRQRPPCAAVAAQVQDAVDDLPHVHTALTPARIGRWDQRLDQLPLRISQIGWIGTPFHPLFFG